MNYLLSTILLVSKLNIIKILLKIRLQKYKNLSIVRCIEFRYALNFTYSNFKIIILQLWVMGSKKNMANVLLCWFFIFYSKRKTINLGTYRTYPQFLNEIAQLGQIKGLMLLNPNQLYFSFAVTQIMVKI